MTTLNLESIPSVLRVHSAGCTIDLDIVEAELALEEIAIKYANNPKEIYAEMQQWVNERHGINLNITEVWSLFLAIREAYAAYKKKFATVLASLNTTDSTPGHLPTTNETST